MRALNSCYAYGKHAFASQFLWQKIQMQRQEKEHYRSFLVRTECFQFFAHAAIQVMFFVILSVCAPQYAATRQRSDLCPIKNKQRQ